MIEVPLALAGGLLGSAHCVGMCGGFALTLGTHAPTWRANLVRQLAYTAGRICTYAFCGAVIGFCGLRLRAALPTAVNLQAVLALVAGAFLLWQGLLTLGLLPRIGGPVLSAAGCQAAKAFRVLLSAPSLGGAFLSGVATGFLPCGLVYAYLALAAAATHWLSAVLLMAAFGAGTGPLMILVGLSGQALRLSWRRRAVQIAAVCVLLTGCLSIGRGLLAMERFQPDDVPACPYCGAAETASRP